MLKFPGWKRGSKAKETERKGKEKRATKEGMERKGKDQGEKGNGIYLGSMLRKKERARKKKQSLLPGRKNFFEPWCSYRCVVKVCCLQSI